MSEKLKYRIQKTSEFESLHKEKFVALCVQLLNELMYLTKRLSPHLTCTLHHKNLPVTPRLNNPHDEVS